MAHRWNNKDRKGRPIVIHRLVITCKIYNNNHQYFLKHKLIKKFSKYGKILSYSVVGRRLIFIGYENDENRDKAVDDTNLKLLIDSKQFLIVCRYYSNLYRQRDLILYKLENLNIDINKLVNCNNYWNKYNYPEYIINYGLKNGISEINQNDFRFHIHCYHKDIYYPFIIHLASSKRIKQHILCVRPATKHEIGIMLKKCNISLLKQILTGDNSFDIDWKTYDKIWSQCLLSHYAFNQLYDNMDYMINKLRCNPTDFRYKLLHIAAIKHNFKLVIDCLNKYNINPLIRDYKWNKTPLQHCVYSWKKYLKTKKLKLKSNKIDKRFRNIIDFNYYIYHNYNNNQQFDIVYIKSVLLSNFMYIHYDGNIRFFNVAEKYKSFAQFSLEMFFHNHCVIKIKSDNIASYNRIKALNGYRNNINSDFILTANIQKKTIEFIPANNLTPNSHFCWRIQKQVINQNDVGYTFAILFKNRIYHLYTTNNNCKLQLKEFIPNNDVAEIKKSWFSVLKYHKFKGRAKCEWQQQDQSSLRFNTKNYNKIVRELLVAMHNNNNNNIINNNYMYNGRWMTGFCKTWMRKGYGLIQMDDGSDDVFVDQKDIKSAFKKRLYLGETVQFNMINVYGRREARNVFITYQS